MKLRLALGSGVVAMIDSQLIDILLNRHGSYTQVSDMVRSRYEERELARKIVRALPPGIEQRTPAWYAARKGMLTASEFKTAGSECVSASYVLGKVFPQPFVSNDAMTWGCRFEDLACATYEFENETPVREFGLLVHPDSEWIGASPDGITDYGVALEFKVPYSRRLVEVNKRLVDERPFPKNDKANLHGRYRAQVQGQLEVCNLELCDFTVAHIDALDSSELFWQLRRVSDARHRYAIVVDVPKAGCGSNGPFCYRTSPLNVGDDELREWLSSTVAGSLHVRVWYAHVRELGVERIARDREHWARLRTGLGNTKDAINAIMAGAADAVEGAKPILGNPSLFSTDDQDSETCVIAMPATGSSAGVKKASESLFSDD